MFPVPENPSEIDTLSTKEDGERAFKNFRAERNKRKTIFKPMYYIIFEDYVEWNQFEGEWTLNYKEFQTLEEANRWLENSNPGGKIIGPLVEVKNNG